MFWVVLDIKVFDRLVLNYKILELMGVKNYFFFLESVVDICFVN